MNPIVQELRSKMHYTTTPSWANRAADEIERLERERDELQATADRFAEIMADKDRQLIAAVKLSDDLLAALHEIAGHSGHILSGSLASMRKIASDAIAKARGQQS